MKNFIDYIIEFLLWFKDKILFYFSWFKNIVVIINEYLLVSFIYSGIFNYFVEIKNDFLHFLNFWKNYLESYLDNYKARIFELVVLCFFPFFHFFFFLIVFYKYFIKYLFIWLDILFLFPVLDLMHFINFIIVFLSKYFEIVLLTKKQLKRFKFKSPYLYKVFVKKVYFFYFNFLIFNYKRIRSFFYLILYESIFVIFPKNFDYILKKYFTYSYLWFIFCKFVNYIDSCLYDGWMFLARIKPFIKPFIIHKYRFIKGHIKHFFLLIFPIVKQIGVETGVFLSLIFRAKGRKLAKRWWRVVIKPFFLMKLGGIKFKIFIVWSYIVVKIKLFFDIYNWYLWFKIIYYKLVIFYNKYIINIDSYFFTFKIMLWLLCFFIIFMFGYLFYIKDQILYWSRFLINIIFELLNILLKKISFFFYNQINFWKFCIFLVHIDWTYRIYNLKNFLNKNFNYLKKKIFNFFLGVK